VVSLEVWGQQHRPSPVCSVKSPCTASAQSPEFFHRASLTCGGQVEDKLRTSIRRNIMTLVNARYKRAELGCRFNVGQCLFSITPPGALPAG
jgi:hypothetical protein